MYPAVWGQEFWSVIHLIAFIYPDNPTIQKKKSVSILLENLCPNLPCVGCSIHCSKYLIGHPPILDNRSNFIKWTIDFHNAVNKRTGKRVLSQEEAYQKIIDKFFIYDNWIELKKSQMTRIEDHKDIEKWKRKALSSGCYKISKTSMSLVATVLFILVILVITSIFLNNN